MAPVSICLWTRAKAVASKSKMTITSRYRAHTAPRANMDVAPGEFITNRLTFSRPTAKMTWSYETLAETIDAAPDGTLFFPDTSIYTRERDKTLWDALLKRDLVIPPMVHYELRDWRRDPWYNEHVRRAVLCAEFVYSSGLQLGPSRELAPGVRCPQLLTIGPRYEVHGYRYLFSLLSMRKLWGPNAFKAMESRLKRPPTSEEFAAAVQSQLGPRGLMLATKGLENYTSPNLFTDEQLVVTAIISGIVRKHSICILTKDRDVEEQFYKCLALLTRQYEAMIVGDYYAANSDRLSFQPRTLSGTEIGVYENDAIVECRLPRREFRKLFPALYCPIKIVCLLIGGDNSTLKVTSTTFTAETEMTELLKLKSQPGALNTDKFGDKNVRVMLLVDEPGGPANHIYIGNETRLRFGDLEFSQPDSFDVLHDNERIVYYEQRQK
jgi:hypothetical protein